MRFFIRNKQKYNPGEAFENPIIAVDVDNTQEICKIKEVCEVLLLWSLVQLFAHFFLFFLCRRRGELLKVARLLHCMLHGRMVRLLTWQMTGNSS